MEYQLPTVETIISITPNEHEGIYMKTMQRFGNTTWYKISFITTEP